MSASEKKLLVGIDIGGTKTAVLLSSTPPEVISRNMREGRIGMRTGSGFLDYSGLDVDAYREQRLAAMVELLRHFGLARPPVLDRD